MSYFLRNFVDAYSSTAYTPNNRKDYVVANNFVDDGTSSPCPNLPFESSHLTELFGSDDGGGANALQLDFQAYSDHKHKCRNRYSKLLLLYAKQLHRSGILYSANADLDAIAMQQECLQNNVGEKMSSEAQQQWRKCIAAGEFELDVLLEANKYISVIAPPSCWYSALFNLRNGDRKQVNEDDNFDSSSHLTQAVHNLNSPDQNAPQQRHGFELMTIGLDSIFSVMLELNQRDSELCAKQLQSLLQLLQNLPTDTLRNEPRSVVERMHNLLKQLRVEGNASVSTFANACMISLSVAYGHPEFMLSTICALLCDAKKNIPFNQLSSDCNLLPKNFQNLALTVQKNVQRGVHMPESEHLLQWSNLSKSGDFLCDFELLFPSSQSSMSDFHGADGALAMANGSLVSNGSYVFVLTMYGLVKTGTGLTETKNGEILTCNELLKYSEGSVLLVCNESLYLRRKHSSRLWVLDVESLREIGEIMLPNLLSEGVLFSDGRSFYHALLDDQWNFTTTLLDDATFTPVPGQKARQSSRLIEIGYTAIGDVNDFQANLIKSIPSSLQGIVVDIQLSSEIGFILTRHGKVFYAGQGMDFDLQDTNLTWTELPLIETIVGMTCHSNCLILRSGSGHLWEMGSLTDFFDNQHHSKTPTKKARKIRIPNKRRCTSVASTAGCMGYVTDNGRCFFYGRHVITSQDEVIVSKSGMLYTSGLNNMNQCGREENPRFALPCPSSTSPDAVHNLKNLLPTSTNSIHSTGSSGAGYCPKTCTYLSCSDLVAVNRLASLSIDEKLDEEEECSNYKESGMDEVSGVEELEEGEFEIPISNATNPRKKIQMRIPV
uniref:Uncharacterized protein n=1 Tax=Ditylenchus dipsaci TaxID=166011 RepID=A0A915DDI4_9BILA